MSRRTTIIETTGPIAAGKSTLSTYLFDSNSGCMQVNNGRRVFREKRSNFFILFLFFCRFPFFCLRLAVYIIKTGNTFHNSIRKRFIKLFKMLKKWSHAWFTGGAHWLDEGLCKHFSVEMVRKTYPGKRVNLILVHVTADPEIRSKRIKERMKRKRVKKSHQAVASNLQNHVAAKKNPASDFQARANKAGIPCFVIDTSPHKDWDEQVESLYGFLQQHIPAD